MLQSTPSSARREAAALAPPALVLVAVLQFATLHDAGHRALALASLTVVVTQILPGALVWRLIRPVHGWLVEDAIMGLAVGAALAVPVHVIGVATGLPWLDAALPVALALALVAMPASRARIGSRESAPLPWAWGATVALSMLGPLLNVRSTFESTPLQWKGFATLYVDVPYHNALVGEVLNHFPPHYPQVAQETLAYHWFSHAWTAQVATVSGAEVDTLLWRFNPSLLMVAAPLVVAVAAMRLSRLQWAGPAAALLAFLLTDVSPWAEAMVTTPLHGAMSPTQQLSVLLIGAVVTLLVLRWRGEAARSSVLVLLLLVVVTGGTKGSTLPVVLAGCGFALAVAALAAILKDGRGALWRRGRIGTVAADTALIGITLAVLNKVMFGGGDGGLALDLGHDYVAWRAPSILGLEADPTGTTGIVAAVLTVVALVLGPIGGLALLAVPETRRDPAAWLLIGGGAAGIGALVLLTHPGLAQVYFYKAAEPLIAIAGAWGTGLLVARAGHVRRIVPAGAAIGAGALPVVILLFVNDAQPTGLGPALVALALFTGIVLGGAAITARATTTGLPGAMALGAVALLFAGTVPAVTFIDDFTPEQERVFVNPWPGAISDADVAALRALKDISDVDDIVITNNHCRAEVADPCDRRRFYIGGFAHRRVLIEGWTYNKRASTLYADHGPALFSNALFWDQPLLELNDGFIAAPDAAQARALWDLDVRWIVVWHDAPHAADLSPYATLERRGLTLDIYRLVPPA